MADKLMEFFHAYDHCVDGADFFFVGMFAFFVLVCFGAGVTLLMSTHDEDAGQGIPDADSGTFCPDSGRDRRKAQTSEPEKPDNDTTK